MGKSFQLIAPKWTFTILQNPWLAKLTQCLILSLLKSAVLSCSHLFIAFFDSWQMKNYHFVLSVSFNLTDNCRKTNTSFGWFSVTAVRFKSLTYFKLSTNFGRSLAELFQFRERMFGNDKKNTKFAVWSSIFGSLTVTASSISVTINDKLTISRITTGRTFICVSFCFPRNGIPKSDFGHFWNILISAIFMIWEENHSLNANVFANW